MSGLPAPGPAVTMEAGAGAGLVMVDGEQLAGPGHAPGPAQDQLQTPPTFPGQPQPPPSHEAVNFANEVGPPRLYLHINAQNSASHMFTLVFVLELYFSTIDRGFQSCDGSKLV